jgi:formylglycine-generating enzyme required for sulfatase activity
MQSALVELYTFHEPDIVEIPGGNFLMGCESGNPNERPVHRVSLNSFAIGRYQVTNREYSVFLQATNHREPKHWSDPKFNHPLQPVVAVSWFDAVAYCEWLTIVTGKKYRLPTETEWEYASRGGIEGLAYPWGNEPTRRNENPNRWRDERPEIVGLSEPNRFGIFNMCENVHEWCADWFDAKYYSVSPAENPQGPESGTSRSSRGGSWRHQIKTTRCAARSSINPEFEYSDYGFRVAAFSRVGTGVTAVTGPVF